MKRETDPARRQQIRQKRKTFAWLSRFFRNRPSRRDLIDAHVLQEESSAPAKNKFFGIPLDEVYADQSRLVNNVPIPVYQCAITIEKFLDLEGIFRVSGTFSEMNRLTEEFESGKMPDLTKVENKHSVSGLLEKYFRELPQPVTTWAMYEDFMKAADENLDAAGQIQYLQTLIQQMDPPNSALLGYFLALMKKISKHEDVNKMGAKNLGVVFGSIILGPENLLLTLGDKKKLQNQSVVVGLLISHCYELYPQYRDDDAGDDDGDEIQLPVAASADDDAPATTTTASDS